uniref:SAC domain-containing protein n=1 Tax=Panagrolaimus davidi TaxID=227884 RepID=A0A914QNI0_9BILA
MTDENVDTEKFKQCLPNSMRLSSLDIYETTSHFYIIGTDSTKIKYHVLKLDRNADQTFLVGEPNHSYTRKDVDELLSTISSIVTSQKSRSSGNALLQTIKGAYGILGAVRFLEGYHLLVVTKAKAVALLGHHDIYKVEEVQSVYIPSATTTMSPDEQRYAKLFQSVDLTTNFYFSYTYDLSRTLQENALAQRELKFNKTKYHRKIDADRKFIWNDYLLKPFKDNLVTDKWCLEIVHGYVGQQIIELPCSKLALILIGRRSAIFAGTRFLKRGMDFSGAVANDVETEQIVWDMYSTPSIETGNFTAYVQRRGSIPLFWSQDPSTRGVVGKPPVIVDLVEPNALTTAAHFKDLRHKYGYPISIINLVKRRGGPKTQDEKMLHAQFLKTVKYLNQFMKPGKKIDYISFGMSL